MFQLNIFDILFNLKVYFCIVKRYNCKPLFDSVCVLTEIYLLVITKLNKFQDRKKAPILLFLSLVIIQLF